MTAPAPSLTTTRCSSCREVIAFALTPSPLDLPGWLVLPRPRVAFYRDGVEFKSPRNRTAFWSTQRPAPPPVTSWVIGTGDTNIRALTPRGTSKRKIRNTPKETP